MRTRSTICLALSALASGCASGGSGGPPETVYQYVAEYRVSCNVSDECRVQYIDEDGALKAEDIVGEWKRTVGVNAGSRLWVRASGGGCPPRPVRVEIALGEDPVAETTERATHQSRCDWILAETEFTVP